MDRRRTTMWLAVSLLVIALLAGCGQSRLQVGMMENHLPGRWEARYTTLIGTREDTVRADAGQTLTLDYDVKVEKGTLSITVTNPERKALWQVSLQEGEKDRIQLDLDQDGRYTIAVDGDSAGGSFDLSWGLE
jgi:hypothetical protein